eukprot:COSAG04_NODE_158_length_22122_cov_49.992326_2_plen_36_part_00
MVGALSGLSGPLTGNLPDYNFLLVGMTIRSLSLYP